MTGFSDIVYIRKCARHDDKHVFLAADLKGKLARVFSPFDRPTLSPLGGADTMSDFPATQISEVRLFVNPNLTLTLTLSITIS